MFKEYKRNGGVKKMDVIITLWQIIVVIVELIAIGMGSMVLIGIIRGILRMMEGEEKKNGKR